MEMGSKWTVFCNFDGIQTAIGANKLLQFSRQLFALEGVVVMVPAASVEQVDVLNESMTSEMSEQHHIGRVTMASVQFRRMVGVILTSTLSIL